MPRFHLDIELTHQIGKRHPVCSMNRACLYNLLAVLIARWWIPKRRLNAALYDSGSLPKLPRTLIIPTFVPTDINPKP